MYVRPEVPVIESVLSTLRERFGERCSTSMALREQHGRDESHHPVAPPDVVVFPETTEEVAEIVTLCARHRTAIIPFGVGTSLEGQVTAPYGGVCVDLSRMNRILAVRPEDMDVTVQAGVTRKQLNEHLRDTGLFFPIDPGADATIAGMASTRASGTNAVRYGTMREAVLSLTVVLPSGKIIRTARRARKSAAGYDLTRLFVGAEGTLGIITEVTLRLHGIPEAVSGAICAFPNMRQAVDSVIQIIQVGIPVARIELMDAVTARAVNAFSKLSLREAPTLFFEFHGSPAFVAEQAELAQAITADNGGEDFHWTTDAEERARLWQARHDAYYASLALRPGSKGWATDVCVPISALAQCIDETMEDLKTCPVPVAVVGHVGDGNFHCVFMLEPGNKEEEALVAAYNDRLVKRALALDGTCTGEHGIGVGKIGKLAAELGEAVEVMRGIKAALDPDFIMNPGKMMAFG